MPASINPGARTGQVNVPRLAQHSPGRRYGGPQLLATGFCGDLADETIPGRLGTKLVAPRPQPSGAVIKPVFLREPDRAVNLVGDCGANARCFTGARLGGFASRP